MLSAVCINCIFKASCNHRSKNWTLTRFKFVDLPSCVKLTFMSCLTTSINHHSFMKHYITFRGVSKSFAPSKEKTDGSLRSKHEATVAGEKNTLQGGETSIRPRLWRVSVCFDRFGWKDRRRRWRFINLLLNRAAVNDGAFAPVRSQTHYSVAETAVCQSVSRLEALQAVVECQQPEADLYRWFTCVRTHRLKRHWPKITECGSVMSRFTENILMSNVFGLWQK